MPEICDPSVSGADYLLDFEFIKAFTCMYTNTAGFLVTGLLVYGAVNLAIYVRTGSIMIPAVLVLLTGGAILGQVAAPAVTFAVIIVLLAGAGVFTYVYWRYSR